MNDISFKLNIEFPSPVRVTLDEKFNVLPVKAPPKLNAIPFPARTISPVEVIFEFLAFIATPFNPILILPVFDTVEFIEWIPILSCEEEKSIVPLFVKVELATVDVFSANIPKALVFPLTPLSVPAFVTEIFPFPNVELFNLFAPYRATPSCPTVMLAPALFNILEPPAP